MAENLVLYNIDRVKIMAERWTKDKGEFTEFTWPGDDYNSILSALDFIKKEMERNYNPTAHFVCSWKGCRETFDGWKAYDRLVKHDVDKHKDKCQAQMIAVGGIMALMIDALDNPDWLVEQSGGKASREYAKLKKKGKDVPLPVLQAYYEEHNEYMDAQDPNRKWHKPIEFAPPEGVSSMPGRKTLIKETVKGIWRALHPSKETYTDDE